MKNIFLNKGVTLWRRAAGRNITDPDRSMPSLWLGKATVSYREKCIIRVILIVQGRRWL